MSQILTRPSLHIGNAMQQFLDAKEVEGIAQIITNVIDECKLKITAVARQGRKDIQKREDFSGEDDRGMRQGAWYVFCRKAWGGIHNHMAEHIQVLGSNVHQDVLAKLNLGFELFRNELGAQLNWLAGIHGQLAYGVNHLANAVDSKLLESSERSDREERVISELYTAMRKVMVELENNKVYNIQTKGHFASVSQKLEGAHQKIEGEVQRSIGSVLHRYNESMKKEETKGDAKLLSKPCLVILS